MAFDKKNLKKGEIGGLTYQCVLVDFSVRRVHGLDHELVAVLVVRVVLERLQAH